MSNKPVVKKEQTLNEAQLKKVVRAMARKAIQEHVASKKKNAALKEGKKLEKPKSQKITKTQLREMVRDSILECLEEELDKRMKAKSKNKKRPAPAKK